MKTNQQHKKAVQACFNARCFLDAAKATSDYKKKQQDSNPKECNLEQFEALTVGVMHAFAFELFIKGIMLANGHEPVKGHDLKKLLESNGCQEIYKTLQKKFQQNDNFKNQNFDSLMEQHKDLFVELRYNHEILDSTEVKVINLDFTSFLGNELMYELNRLVDFAY